MIDPPLIAEVSTEQFAKQVLVGLYQTIIAQEQGALNGDVNAIHDMRVATRRLRVAVGNFAVTFPREDRLRLQSRLKNLAEVLGGVRDFDVVIEALESRVATDRRGERAIRSVIGRFRERRRRRLRQLVNYLGGQEFAEFKQEYSFFGAEEVKRHGQAA
jgi:CHAD domain-containing protein